MRRVIDPWLWRLQTDTTVVCMCIACYDRALAPLAPTHPQSSTMTSAAGTILLLPFVHADPPESPRNPLHGYNSIHSMSLTSPIMGPHTIFMPTQPLFSPPVPPPLHMGNSPIGCPPPLHLYQPIYVPQYAPQANSLPNIPTLATVSLKEPTIR